MLICQNAEGVHAGQRKVGTPVLNKDSCKLSSVRIHPVVERSADHHIQLKLRKA